MWNNEGGFDGGYGNDGGSGGGGFMNNQGEFNSPASAKKERRSQNNMCVTIGTINDCTEDILLIEGREIHMVTLVGIIRSIDMSSIKTTYTIDDHTGVIEVLRYPDGDGEVQPDNITEGLYARVFGPMRFQQGKKHVVAFKVEQIEDPNLITTHILETIYQRKKLKQMSESPAARPSAVLANSSLVEQPSVNTGGGLGPEKDMVYATIKSCNSEQGMSRTMIQTVLKGKMHPDKIERLVEELSGDGIIYTTHDDDHFMVIEG